MTIRISFLDKTVKVAVEINGEIESLITELPQRPWVGLTKETMLFIIAKHTHLKMRYHEDETTVIDEHVEAEQLVREVEALLKEKNS